MPAVVRFDPFRDLAALREDMNRVFARTLGDALPADAAWAPAIDIRETPDEIVMSVEVPGLDAEDIDIEVEDNVLTISGERRFEERSEDEHHHRVERRYGRFSRSVTLPQNVTTDDIRADLERGVLEVHVPKAEEARPRKIAVRSGTA